MQLTGTEPDSVIGELHSTQGGSSRVHGGLFPPTLGFHTCLLGPGLDHSRSPTITILDNHIVWLAFRQWVDLAQCEQFSQADNETS